MLNCVSCVRAGDLISGMTADSMHSVRAQDVLDTARREGWGQGQLMLFQGHCPSSCHMHHIQFASYCSSYVTGEPIAACEGEKWAGAWGPDRGGAAGSPADAPV